MTMTIDLTPELETQLQDEASKRGVSADDFVANAIRKSLMRNRSDVVERISELESQLLEKINIGLSEETWEFYNDLVEKRRAEKLTPDEHTKLMQISDEIERRNAERIAHLAELARLKNVTLRDLMQQLLIF